MKSLIILMMVLLANIWADTHSLLKAHKEALNVYQSKDRDFYKSIKLLRDAGIQDVLQNQPKEMKSSQYVQLLNDYGFFLSLTEISSKWYGPNYCEAKKALEKVKELAPDRAPVYLNLGDLYWKIYKANSMAGSLVSKMARHSYHDADCIRRKQDEASYPYLAKQEYVKYTELMKKNNREKQIPERIRLMLESNKMFVLLYVLNKDHSQVCKSYIDTLNRLQDRNYCNRNMSTIKSEFKLLHWEDISQKNRDRYRGEAIPFQFKDNTFIDYIGYQLYRFREKYDSFKPICRYGFFDFSLKKRSDVHSGGCPNIREYE